MTTAVQQYADSPAFRLQLTDRAPLFRLTDLGSRICFVNANLIECIAASTTAAGNNADGSQVFLTGWEQPLEVMETPSEVYHRASQAQRKL